MAVSSAPESSGQGDVWWSSWLTSAKEKSINALSATKRDLAEFVSVLGSDTKAVVEEASANFNKILKQPSDDSSMDETTDGKKKASVRVVEPQAPYDRCQAELFALQSNTDTYLQDPSNQDGECLDDNFDTWKSSFDIQQHQSDISNLLVSCHHVRSNHSQLVPAKVSYETFWMRYFYKAQRLQKEEKRREDLMARASNRAQEQLQWDEEVEVISNPLLLKAVTSGHQRSESSTDSFVCVSEETGLEGEHSPLRAAADTESWEHLGSGVSGESRESSGGRLSDVGEEEEDVKKGLDRLFKKHGSPLQASDEEETVDLGACKEAGEGEELEGEVGSNSSDWEKWDD